MQYEPLLCGVINMKKYSKIVNGCSECPNTYVGGTSEYRYGMCKDLKRRVYEIDDATYDEDKDESNYHDEIPKDCPLPNAT